MMQRATSSTTSPHPTSGSAVVTDPAPATETTGHRILIVDDDMFSRTLLQTLLTRAGYEVSTADEGATALAMTAGSPPDLVLLDYMMPGMDGPEVAKRMRTQRNMADVPIMMLTASERDVHIEQGLGAGVDDYLIKPIDHRILIMRVKKALRAREDRHRAASAQALVAELQEAREVQQAQIPKAAIIFPGWKVVGGVLPCGSVGGDLFDVMDGIDGHKVAVLIDISGHGVGAALVAAGIHADLRGLLLVHSIAPALAILNDRLCNDRSGKYACIAAVEVSGANVTVINAGLPPVCVLRDGTMVASVRATGTPLGLFPKQMYGSETIRIASGDRVILMSDGLTEPFGNADDVEPTLQALGLLDANGFECDGLGPVSGRIRHRISEAPSESVDDATLMILEARG